MHSAGNLIAIAAQVANWYVFPTSQAGPSAPDVLKLTIDQFR
jgi:hypothetical protein